MKGCSIFGLKKPFSNKGTDEGSSYKT
ncbi:hypothetical protein SCFA_940004 [anaerobic digester metagenome]|uniref:Uncharacterized protein n=1 Tax=anaerobic digester metagenome TaxID=1263854 RepID=A0A485M7L9_9ZZZZ